MHVELYDVVGESEVSLKRNRKHDFFTDDFSFSGRSNVIAESIRILENLLEMQIPRI